MVIYNAEDLYGSCDDAQPETFCRDMTVRLSVIGAGVGVLLDFLRDRSELRVTLLDSKPKPALFLSPIAGHGRSGMALRVRF